ncbi:MAG: hypothetical protein K6E28_03015 [Eubacterium sp.]|nr:hypothetical protein [Eubacterium sp.]
MKDRVKNLVKFIIFATLVVLMVIQMTYLFRNTDRNSRQNVLGFYEEPEGSLDVVVVGGSSVYRYWSPMKAWKEFGITSYDYSVSAMGVSVVKTAVTDIRKHQPDAAIVVDGRAFFYAEDIEKTELGMSERNVLDSLDIGYDRLKAVNYLVSHSNLSREEKQSEYIDLIEYHDNYAALGDETHWKLSDNRVNGNIDGDSFFKGFALSGKQKSIEILKWEDALSGVTVADDAEGTEGTEGTDDESVYITPYYKELLEYASENNIKLFIVISPCGITPEQAKRIVKMQEMAALYNIPFANGVEDMEEMGIDPATDFYDLDHVNILGAEKYTTYLGDKLVAAFPSVTEKTEAVKKHWNETYEKYTEERAAVVIGGEQ